MVQPRDAPPEPAESTNQGQSSLAGAGAAAAATPAATKDAPPTEQAPPPEKRTAPAPAPAPAPAKRKGFAHLFKFVLIGESGVGKTAMVKRYVRDEFTPTRDYTIGVDFDVKTVDLSNGDEVKLQLWDTAGQERFRTITNSYYRGCQGIFIVYDSNDEESFESVSRWLNEVSRYCNDDVVVIIAANKIDQRTPTSAFFGKDKVMALDCVKSGEPEVLGVYECSCKTGEGVDDAFQAAADELVKRRLDEINPLRKGKNFKDTSIKLGDKDTKGKKKGCC